MSGSDRITISEIEFEDVIDVYNLGNKVFTPDKWLNLYRTWDEYEIIERYISDKEYCLVAKQNKKVIAFSLGSLVQKKKNSWLYGYLIWTCVDPKYSGQGLGKKLLNKIMKLFKKAGVKIVLVDTSTENKTALSFFKKNGFEEEEGHVFLSKNISKEK